MKLGWKIVWFAAGVVGWGATANATPMLSAPSLEFSQDGVNYQSFDAVVGRQKIGAYYDYHQRSGHPVFGTQKSTASTALYWDDKHHALSLIVISGVEGRGKGRIKYDFAGLPSTAFASVVDDPKEFK